MTGTEGAVPVAPIEGMPGPSGGGMPEASLAQLYAALRRAVPAIVGEVVLEIRRQMPDYLEDNDTAHTELIGAAGGHILTHFVEQMGGGSSEPSQELLGFFHKAGISEAVDGRSQTMTHRAMAIGTETALRRFAEIVQSVGVNVPPDVSGHFVAQVFPFLDKLMGAFSRGFSEAAGASFGAIMSPRRRILDRLIAEPAPEVFELRNLAQWANWPIPERAAVLLLRARDARPELPPELLDGMHLPEPCAIIPDPDAPGRRHVVEQLAKGRVAVLGPTVAVREIATSLTWARQALELAEDGHLPQDDLIVVAEHVPTLVILRQQDLVEHLTARLLGPLAQARPQVRRHLAETLRAGLECGFNANDVAKRLFVHPQTIRYRFRALKDLFGDTIRDPALTLELLIAVNAWLATGRGLPEAVPAQA